MARKTKEEARETREALLEAASKVFVEKGVAKASLEEIAERAGLTRGAVYWHFKNKADLFQAFNDSLHTPLAETLLRDMEKDHPEPLKQLEDLCVEMLTDLAVNEQKQRILTIFFLKCDYSGEMEPVLGCQCEKKQEKMKLFEKYFQKAKKKGHVAGDVEPRTLTVSLMCYLNGIVNEFLRHPGQIDLKKQAPQLVRQFFYGIYRAAA